MHCCGLVSMALFVSLHPSFVRSAPAEDVTQNESEPALAEIIVTAQKRAQSINDVPMSITAITGDVLAQQGIRDTADLAKIVPGFTSASSNLDTPVYTLRGIGLYDSGLGSSPTVSVYVDQIPLPFPVMTIAANLDLERVEVLEGPQGILFGQNSTGGAINYIAAKPTQSFATGGDVTYERFGKVDVDGFVSGPLSDTVQARLAMRAVQGGAWQYSATRPDDSLGNTREVMGRLLLDWEPTDRLKFAFNVNGNQNQSDTEAWQLEKALPAVPANADPALYDQPVTAGMGNARVADWTPSQPNRMNDSFYQIAVRADYEMSDATRLSSLTSYDHQRIHHFVDNDNTALPLSESNEFGSIASFNQEVRVSYDAARLHGVAGANYEHDKVSDSENFNFDGISSDQPIPTIPPFTHLLGTTNQGIDTYAAFGNLEYSLDNHLSAYGGIRYTYSKRRAHICQTGLNADNAIGQVFTVLQEVFLAAGVKNTPVTTLSKNDCFPLTPAPALSPQTTGTNEELSEGNVSWRGGLQYKADGGTLFYANASKGYKAGVITNVIGSSTSEYTPAKQESVNAYELGIKAPLFDQRVHLDTSVFYYTYDNKQVRTREIDPVFGLLELIVNVPKSTIWGIDGDLVVQPLRGLILSLSGTYLDSKVTSAFDTVNQDGASGNFEGSRLPFTPKVTMVGDAQYEWSVKNGMKPFVGSSLTYRSSDSTSFATAELPAPDYALPSSAVLDLRAGLAANDDTWRVTFFGRNVTNRYYWTFVYDVADSIGRRAAPPVTYGITVSLRTH
jgi:iron complex outermembrane receptor protein